MMSQHDLFICRLRTDYSWHDTNGAAGPEFTDTRGNNALVQEDVNHDNVGGFRPSGGANLKLNFPLNTALDPANYQSAAITNAFYWVNLPHDVHYQYGFTQTAPVGGVHDVLIGNGTAISGRDFGSRAAVVISAATTLEDTLSAAIAVTANAGLGVTSFRISEISGGGLFQIDGVTPILNGDFISAAEGQVGVRFLPSLNSSATGHFDVELSGEGVSVLADTSKAHLHMAAG